LTGKRAGELGISWIFVVRRLWNATRPNPKIANYPHDSALWRKAHAFNRCYTALLDELHTAVTGDPKRLSHSCLAMYDLKQQAVELMKDPSRRK